MSDSSITSNEESSFSFRFAKMWHDLIGSPVMNTRRYTEAQGMMEEADAEIARLRTEHEEFVLKVAERFRGSPVETPKEPPLGLLMSMAIRMDHGLGVPGYYDQPFFACLANNLTHAQRLDATLKVCRQLWEEVVGHGFYHPSREADYAAKAGGLAQETSAHAESDCSTGIGGVTLVQMAENIKLGLDPYAGSEKASPEPDARWADAALTLARQYDQGSGGTFEFDSTTLLRLLREARGKADSGKP